MAYTDYGIGYVSVIALVVRVVYPSSAFENCSICLDEPVGNKLLGLLTRRFSRGKRL